MTKAEANGNIRRPKSVDNRGAQSRIYPLFVSTWAFGKAANAAALENYQQGGSRLDAVETGIRVTEADISNASVGVGGIPNADGVVQLDACIMDGPGHRAGSVVAIEDIAIAILIYEICKAELE